LREYIDHPTVESQWPLAADTIKALKTLYLFRDESTVTSFLEKHPFLTPLLLRAHEKIEEYFGPSNIVLDAPVDPDDPEYVMLWARVQTTLEAADAVRKLTRFDEEWWLDTPISALELMNVNLEFV